MNAKLPGRMEKRHLSDMEVGETAYVVPWAMWADSERRLWLRASHTPDHRPGGTVAMKIQRVSDGFRAWPVPGHTYEVGGGGEGWDPLPVIELVLDDN